MATLLVVGRIARSGTRIQHRDTISEVRTSQEHSRLLRRWVWKITPRLARDLCWMDLMLRLSKAN